MVRNIFQKVFGSRNERLIKRLRKQVEKVTLTTPDGTVKREFNCDLLVASAGNESSPEAHFPSGLPGVISVGAVVGTVV